MRKLTVIAIIAVAVGFLAFWWGDGLQHFLSVHTGTADQSGIYNTWWSGFGSVIVPPILSVGGLGTVYWWHHTCHIDKCYWLAKHVHGDYSICRRHHNRLLGNAPKHKITFEHVLHRR